MYTHGIVIETTFRKNIWFFNFIGLKTSLNAERLILNHKESTVGIRNYLFSAAMLVAFFIHLSFRWGVEPNFCIAVGKSPLDCSGRGWLFNFGRYFRCLLSHDKCMNKNLFKSDSLQHKTKDLFPGEGGLSLLESARLTLTGVAQQGARRHFELGTMQQTSNRSCHCGCNPRWRPAGSSGGQKELWGWESAGWSGEWRTYSRHQNVSL